MTVTTDDVKRLLRQDEDPERVRELVALMLEEWRRSSDRISLPTRSGGVRRQGT